MSHETTLDRSTVLTISLLAILAIGIGALTPPTAACTTPAECDDGNPCTADDCVAEACVNLPVTDGTTCDDGDTCTTDDQCLAGECVPTTGNPITWENCRPGTPESAWEVSGAGDPSIQGFATDISVDRGDTVDFKIATDATDYRLDIYRMGYYGGLGARQVDTVQPSASLPQDQPACLTAAPDPSHADRPALLDCGNWAVSASWTVPADATSGIYLAKLVREDPEDGRASHVVFIVRHDDGGSDLLFQTADTTWQAYNLWGESGLLNGNSLYNGPGGHAFKISYNRPFSTRASPTEDWLFNAEYPMVRWLERNGYDVSYFTGVDTDRLGSEILEHRAFLSVGHDEYWSRSMRDNVTTARDAGVHLGFFSGNEVYWKIRWEDSIDGSGTPHRTLVCYKEGTLGELACGGKCDPEPTIWTGLWRDGCAFASADGCEPENALSGQISWDGTTYAIRVPDTYAPLRFWRDTSVADLTSGQTRVLPSGTLGYEWDFQQYFEHYPPGIVRMSSATYGAKTHQISLYRHASGALVFGAGTVQWSWGLDSEHDRGSNPPDSDMQQATVNLFADMGIQPATLQAGLVQATASTDATPPTSTITSPGEGASVSGLVAITGTAVDTGGGTVGGVEISTDGGTTWNRAAGLETWSYDWIATQTGPATLLSRAVDDSGRIETPGVGVNVTVTARDCPCTIWADTSTPSNPANNDGQAIELGVKLRTTRDGYITALRFYKGAGTTGPYTGNLWTSAGVLMASQEFTGTTASGWQEVTLSSPVAVTADTTYVASYFSAGGHYAFDPAYFTSALDNPPLRALADGEDGPNGVYAYGPTSTFPTTTYNASNYWVDVVFSDTATDTTPPTVTTKDPAPDETDVPVGTDVRAIFSEPVQESTIDFRLRDSMSALVAASMTYDGPTRTAILTPDAPLAANETYTATVSGAQDVAGNPMAGPDTWSFTTAGPPPDEGPGGPILVVTTAAEPVGRFFAEVLRTEGFNAFTATDVANLTPALLSGYEVAILASMPLTPGQVTTLTDWVTSGGKLIAIRPDAQLASLLGLVDQASTLSEGYLLIDTGQAPGIGIVGETMQFHGDADLYALDGARAVATLYSDATTPTSSPAVSLHGVGTNGGWAAAFTYDLARSLVYTRQGNPAWEGDERDGTPPIRSDDLFFGNKAGDPQPDWVDLDKVAIPQADEQQRLLANLMLHVSARPLPRFWYFPAGHKAVVLLTADEHGGGGGARSRFNSLLAKDPPGCSVDDWACPRASGYIYANGDLTDAEADTFTTQGFELGAHVNTGCADFTEASLRSTYTSDLTTFVSYYPSLPPQDSERTHCVAWSDWASQPTIKAENGIRLDVNYYYWPPAWIGTKYAGVFTGSAMPMRFVALDGSMIDVYQAATQMTDESGQPYPSTIDTLLDRAVGPEGFYGVYTANIHTDGAGNGTTDLIVDSAQARGVPVVSGRQLLAWLDGRNASSFGSQTWDGATLGFTVAAGAGATNLQAMLPTSFDGVDLTSLTRDGSPVPTTTATVKGVEYALFSADAGAYQATFAPDSTPPVLTGVSATAPGDGTALVTWTTDEAADSRVDYGTDPGDLTLSESDAAPTITHAVTLTGLAPGTTYHYRVTSADAASNAATVPDPPAAPLTFTTPAPICFADDVTADFQAGTADANTYLAESADGEVILVPTEGSEFSGGALPAGWAAPPWAAGGGAVVSGGTATVDAALLRTDAFHGPGRSVEFRATFQADSGQHGGFGTDLNAMPWAIFSTKTGGALWARTSATETQLPSVTLGVPHTFRVDWGANTVTYRVDGGVVATHGVTIADAMRPVVSDLDLGGGAVEVDWMRMTPYATPALYTSRVFGGGALRTWGALAWTAGLPPGTDLTMKVRTGNGPVPDGTWSGWSDVPTSGTDLGLSSYYLQYQAQLSTTDTAETPSLEDVSLSCETSVDTTPPTVTGRTPAPGSTGVSASTAVSADFSETMEPSSITTTTFRLRAAGAPSDVPASVSTVGPTATLTPDAPLEPATGYTVTVDAGVTDLAGNPLGSDDVWTFTTSAVPTCTTDSTVADFDAGDETGGTYLAESADGELLLVPTEGVEFFGPTLPPGWQSLPWNAGGYATIAGGVATIESARVWTEQVHGPGHTLEFVATFGNVLYQHVGFVADSDFNGPWAIFSTNTTSTTLYARVNDSPPAAEELISLGDSWLGAPHRYEIEWTASGFEFRIDGNVVHTSTRTIGQDLAVVASDRPALDGIELVVDWIRLRPYATAGSFDSRIFDAGQSVAWQDLTEVGDLPSGAGYAFETRTGDTPTPDPSWSDFVALGGSSIASPDGRYLQYRATLTTSDGDVTPELRSVTVCSVSCTPADCNDGNSCTTDTCVGGTCQHDPVADGTTCDDGSLCTDLDQCLAGTCGGTPIPGCCLGNLDCDDGNACNTEVCNAGNTCEFSSFTCGLSGRITYYRDSGDPEGVEDASDKGVPDVTVVMSGDASGVTVTAPDTGAYALTAGGDETVTPQPTVGLFVKPGPPDHQHGISSLDASWIARHTVSLLDLSPHQITAADVSGNGDVTSYDAALVAQFVVGTITRFPVAVAAGSDWVFVPVFRNERVQDVDLTGVDFAGILYGDVTGNWGEPVSGLAGAADGSSGPATAPGAPGSVGAGTSVEARRAATTIFVASGPTRLPDGRLEVVLGIRGAGEILGMSMDLFAERDAATDVAVETIGVASHMNVVENDRPGRHSVSLYGAEPIAGAGPFLRVVYTSDSAESSPFHVTAEANEGASAVGFDPRRVEQEGTSGPTDPEE